MTSCSELLVSVGAVVKRDLHAQRVYMRTHETRAEAEVSPDVMSATLHAEDGSHVRSFLLQRNRRIEHPVRIIMGTEEVYEPLTNKVKSTIYQTSLNLYTITSVDRESQKIVILLTFTPIYILIFFITQL